MCCGVVYWWDVLFFEGEYCLSWILVVIIDVCLFVFDVGIG